MSRPRFDASTDPCDVQSCTAFAAPRPVAYRHVRSRWTGHLLARGRPAPARAARGQNETTRASGDRSRSPSSTTGRVRDDGDYDKPRRRAHRPRRQRHQRALRVLVPRPCAPRPGHTADTQPRSSSRRPAHPVNDLRLSRRPINRASQTDGIGKREVSPANPVMFETGRIVVLPLARVTRPCAPTTLSTGGLIEPAPSRQRGTGEHQAHEHRI
jgi:hypothetical protein